VQREVDLLVMSFSSFSMFGQVGVSVFMCVVLKERLDREGGMNFHLYKVSATFHPACPMRREKERFVVLNPRCHVCLSPGGDAICFLIRE
jgi:F420-dependent methylenetetrahydromethanopterin dehydrogenase